MYNSEDDEKAALQAILDKDYNKAFKLYDKNRRYNPENASLWFGCGYAKLKLNKLVDANEYFIAAHILNRDNFPTVHNIGYTFLYLGDFSASIRYFDRAIILRNDEHLPYFFKGIALSKMNRPDDAIVLFKTSITKNNAYANSYFELGKAYYKIKDLTQALYNFNQASSRGYSKQEIDEWVLGIKREFDILKDRFSGLTGPSRFTDTLP